MLCRVGLRRMLRGRRLPRICGSCRVSKEWLAVWVQAADLDVGLPILKPHKEFVADWEEVVGKPGPHLVGTEGAELCATPVHVKPFQAIRIHGCYQKRAPVGNLLGG